MRVVHDYPPLMDEIDKKFHVRGKPVIYAWGELIYNPTGQTIAPQLLAHEAVHGRRQGSDVFGWWRRYIDDAAFRLAEEIPAHRAEYLALIGGQPNRHTRRRAMKATARRLAAPLYGVDISRAFAAAVLKQPSRMLEEGA